jgi:spoIIIJ-associated protein
MEPRRSIEATGESIQEAIDNGLAELGAAPHEVIVEVLEEPSRGVFGLGARLAKVRLQLLITRPSAPPPAPPKAASPEQSKRREDRPRRERDNRPRRDEQRQERPARPPKRDKPADEAYMEGHEDDSLPIPDSGEEVPETEITEEVKVARAVLSELLTKMSVEGHIAVRRVETTREGDRDRESAPWLLNVTGRDLNNLIGRRGETLASLQYITRLIASRQLQRRANVIIDVDGYKSRRSQMLRGLALRMADQAIQQKRVISLEPMPPHERRIIHLTLREHEQVTTRSVGEGDGRKVTIVPK